MTIPSELQYDIECNYLKEKYLSDIQQLYKLITDKYGINYLIPTDENLLENDFAPIFIYRFSKEEGIKFKMLEKKNNKVFETKIYYNFDSKFQFGEYIEVNYQKNIINDPDNKILKAYKESGKTIDEFINTGLNNIPRLLKEFKIVHLVNDSNGNALLVKNEYVGTKLKNCDDKSSNFIEFTLPEGVSIIGEVEKYLESDIELEREDSNKRLNKKNIG